MTVKIIKPVQEGAVRAIPSKSAAHRLLICAALANNSNNTETFISCPQRSEDIDATARCLEALGAGIRYGNCDEDTGFFITPINTYDTAGKRVLDCGESGSTLRFLLPICGALGVDVSFEMGGRLPTRPLTGLYEEMTKHGCTLSEFGSSPLTCTGSLSGGGYTLPGNISSQFVSGLLFALPLVESDSIIRVTSNLESRPYVDMTLDALNLFGIEICEEQSNGTPLFHIRGRQKYNNPNTSNTIHVEGDWSNAAFWLAAGAIGTGSIKVEGLDSNSRQGDRAIVELLSRFGANVNAEERGSVTVSRGTLRGIDIDAADIPDLVPVLAAVASVASGETAIRNAGRLRIKESDRLKTIAEILKCLGAEISETPDGLLIRGQDNLSGGETQSFGDHRIAMTAAVLSGACRDEVIIHGAEAVNKSYPAFFDDFTALGGQIG